MKKSLLALALCCVITVSYSQRLLSWSPEFPVENATLSVTVDCNKGNQGLLNFESGNSNNIYVHVGVITNLSTSATDWKYTKFTWGTADANAHATPLGGNKYQYTITNVRSFFGVPAGETIQKVTVIFRNASGSLKQVNSDGSDMYIPVYGNTEYAVRLNLPPFEPRYIPWVEPQTVAVGGSINITGVAAANSALTLTLNGNSIATAASNTTISASPTITTACSQKIMLEGNNGTVIKKDSFEFYIPPTTTIAPLPAGVQEGINYAANNTAATLVLYAPGKSSVVLLGDFTNWAVNCANQMNKTADGNYFWITVTGLTPGTEYGYQYLIDNTIRIADPYAQKILDGDNDQYISSTTYPNLKPYPTGLTTGLVGILQPAEPAYNWQVTNFAKPDKKNLMIYELLIRDFTAQHSYQSLIDSFQYFKNLGINAIELMPVNEFTGNESWGYNPTHYFAPDKYYGTKNKLKEFIDKCHANGIAVLLDVVYNQCDNNAPQAKMYWNSATNQPAANNPWLNVTAPHPYSVFNDFNHTSTATQYLVQRSINFWLDEYKVDGFRFDLAKGFTQTVTNTTTVENYDATRLANLNRYYDGTILNHPNTYMILEFLGTLPCQEEQEYATKGFMLWGNNNYIYNQNTMGYTASSDLGPIVYSDAKKAYSNPAEVGYMESHDEERTMFRNLNNGNSSGSYNVKNLATALAREEAAASVFFTVPGPKMIWQFEERGYDISLVFGGSNLSNKPPHWEYMDDVNRKHLYNTYNSLLQLRLNNTAIFNNTSFTYDFNSGLVKVFQIADPNIGGKKITVVANFDVVAQTKSVTFQSTGDWTNYISNGATTGINGATGTNFNLTAAAQSITLQPGEYHVYISLPPCATLAPTANTALSYCQNATATALTATGTNLLWYTAATGGTGSTTAPVPSTGTAGTTTYYVTQTAGCESVRLPIVVTVTALPAAPAVTAAATYCQNAAAVPLVATGTNLSWYTSATGGTASSTTPTPATNTAGTFNYYVSQKNNCGEGPRANITVTVTATPNASGLSATSITTNGAVLNWTATAGNFYSVDYKAANSSSWINVASNTTTSTTTLSGLASGVAYDWRVSANCTAAVSNNYTTAQFTTAAFNSTITRMKDGLGIKISPDPVTTTASIDYIVPGTGRAIMTLTNVFGQKLLVLANSDLRPGQYNIPVAGQFTGLAKGCYFLRLEQNGKRYFLQFLKQ